ncbi:MAG: glycosyltransferase [Archangiaceae bacterium]|nr:glycosyltransferase [Archangiaceae bacterium]
MKILHLLASPTFSGPAEPVALLAAAQRALGHEVKMAIDRKRLRASSEEPAAPRLQELGLLDETGLELSVKSSPFAALGDMRRLKGRPTDVVHAHFTHDHVIARYGLPRGARLVRSIHAPRSLRVTTPRCDAMTVPYPALLAGLSVSPAMVLPAVVGPAFVPAADRAALRAELGLPPGPLVGMVSTLQESRRHELGLDALARLRARVPQARLVVMGDGERAAVLRARAVTLGVEGAVIFAGYRSATEFPRWVQAFDEVWVLGLGNDFAGRSAAQARSCGARVVTVDEGGLPGYADVVVPAEAGALAEAALRETRRAHAVTPVSEIAQQLLELYTRVGAGGMKRP